MGEDVRISRVAVAQGGLTLRVEESPIAVQPNPFSPGETVVLPRTEAEITNQAEVSLAEVRGGTTLAEVVAGLNALGVGPRDMIDILNNVDKILHIPTFIVQGRYDVVCPTKSAWELHKTLPNSTLSIIPDSGHSMGEFGIAKELVNFTDSV